MTATTHSSTWLIFRIGRVACAVPALTVDSILPLPEHITAIPGADAGSPGLFHHGSGTMAVIDLRHRFGCEAPDPKRGRLLLGHVGGRGYGFWVDAVSGLADAEQVKPAPLPPELPHNVFTAALQYQDEIVLCSDLARLLAMRDAGGLRHLVCAAPPEAATPPVTAETAATAPPPTRPAAPPVREERPMPPAPAPAPPVASAPPVTSPPPPRPAAPLPPRHPPPARHARATAAPSRPAAPVTAPPSVPVRETAAAPAAPSRAAPAPWAPPPRPDPLPPAAPASTPSGIWPAMLLLLAGLAGGGFWLWPEKQTAEPPPAMPVPEPAYLAPMPASMPAPMPAPMEETLPAPEAPAAQAAATPLFQGKGIQVEQNGSDITIIIDRARTEPEPPPASAPDSAAEPEPLTEAETPPPPAIPEPAPPAPAAPQQMYVHTVVRGDTLWAIAEHYLDDPWRYRELAELSRIRNPDLIYPGNKVRIIIR